MANFVPDTLLMLSGGLDSTGALWHLIENKKKIHIHHMNLKNLEKRGLAESIAVKEILKFIDPKCDYYFSEKFHAIHLFH
jgi:7-cyano-7-deazaguanine synthase in queuosine biosynthesis